MDINEFLKKHGQTINEVKDFDYQKLIKEFSKIMRKISADSSFKFEVSDDHLFSLSLGTAVVAELFISEDFGGDGFNPDVIVLDYDSVILHGKRLTLDKKMKRPTVSEVVEWFLTQFKRTLDDLPAGLKKDEIFKN